MERDAICDEYDSELRRIDYVNDSLNYNLKECRKGLNKYKENRIFSILATIVCSFITVSFGMKGHDFFVVRDLAFLFLYPISAAMGVISIGSFVSIINSTSKINYYNERIKSLKKSYVLNQKDRNRVMSSYNAHKSELLKKSRSKIKISDEEHIDELIKMVNYNSMNRANDFDDNRGKRR